MKKALIFVLALVLLVGVLAACGDKKPAETTAGKPAVTTTAPKGTEPKTTTAKTTPAATTTEEVEVTTATYDRVEGITRDPESAGEYNGDVFEGPIDSNPNAD